VLHFLRFSLSELAEVALFSQFLEHLFVILLEIV